MSLQAVSKHLKVLSDAGLLSRSRDAQLRRVHLEAEVFDLMTKWIERYRTQAEAHYRRLDPDVPLVRIAREFDAPREMVFRAHTDPELVVQWLGPRRHETRIEHYDCRTGGSYRYVMASAD